MLHTQILTNIFTRASRNIFLPKTKPTAQRDCRTKILKINSSISCCVASIIKKREADDRQALNWCEIIPLKTYLINHNQSPIKQTVTLQYGIEKKKKLENHSIYYESLLNLVSSTHIKSDCWNGFYHHLLCFLYHHHYRWYSPSYLLKGTFHCPLSFLLSNFSEFKWVE